MKSSEIIGEALLAFKFFKDIRNLGICNNILGQIATQKIDYQTAINYLHRYVDELFFMDEVDSTLITEGIAVDLASLKVAFDAKTSEVMEMATLSFPTNNWKQVGGRVGKHTEHLGHILSELQYMQRAYPNMEW